MHACMKHAIKKELRVAKKPHNVLGEVRTPCTTSGVGGGGGDLIKKTDKCKPGRV